jgi:hypothetical protein
VPAAPADCTQLSGEEKTKCEEAAKAAAPADKTSKAKRSTSNRMEAESTDE